MNSDKSNGANEKSRAIDITRENDELRWGRIDEGFGDEGDEERDGWVSDEHKADRAADFMDSIIRACCLCSSLSMSSRHRRSLHGKG